MKSGEVKSSEIKANIKQNKLVKNGSTPHNFVNYLQLRSNQRKMFRKYPLIRNKIKMISM